MLLLKGMGIDTSFSLTGNLFTLVAHFVIRSRGIMTQVNDWLDHC